MGTKIELSQLQASMFKRLQKGIIRYSDTSAKETYSLKSLVKRGLAKVNGLDHNGDYCRDTYWEVSSIKHARRPLP